MKFCIRKNKKKNFFFCINYANYHFFFFFFCINYNTNFGSTPDPDPWTSPCVTAISTSKQLTIIFICGYKMLLYHLVVFSKNLGRLNLPTRLSSLEIFDFLWIFFHQVPKKKFFFLFWLKISLYLFLVWLKKKKILPAQEGFLMVFLVIFQ